MDWDDVRDAAAVAGVVFALFAAVAALLAIVIVPVAWYGSCREAAVFNAANGTGYSCGDFFWAGGQINSGSSTVRLKGAIP